ncbi:maleylpyruvate isomerase N-terminal domain-containing protein [Catenuloplanes japonicus]|uniref:maleylpyruvate isomerase N-terminal domain-containing protein n=1 Tax=Catenuloplanes japonicus TaxID=33876 RepID=UPI000526A0AE|nr:maleylpyruvate isomerase N-terminal domain-containing protein [Catenuloplanes japonicus]
MIASYLSAARAVADLLAEDRITAAWDRPSALDRMTVGALAGHLARAVTSVPAVLHAPEPDAAPITLVEHYTRSAWVGADLDAPVNTGIRDTADGEAADGPAVLAARTRDALAELTSYLPTERAGRPVLLSWAGWPLTIEDFLTTRMLEISIHVDDLAVSAGLPTPELPRDVLDPVLSLLHELAIRRHGPLAVLRALSRTERAPATIAAI